MQNKYTLMYRRLFSRKHIRRPCSSSCCDTSPTKDFTATYNKFDAIFAKEVLARQDEAKRSILVSVNNNHAAQLLVDYASKFGQVNASYIYSASSRDTNVLLEYDKQESIEKLLMKCNFRDDQTSIPISSIFLKFNKSSNNQVSAAPVETESLAIPNVFTEIFKGNSLSDQIQILHTCQKSTDLETRFRYIICHQLEKTLSGIFPFCKVLPFGSSVNGFGRRSGDLDMILKLHSDKRKNVDNGLFFQSMPPLTNRMLVQRSLDTLGGILHDFVPGCSRVQRILHARVPILKFHHQFTNVDCDMTLSNISGYHMSELLNIFSQCDHRVALLVFAIREWANVNHLTNHSPGKWITNFSLLLLVIFFLQRRPVPVLPTINYLKKLAGKDDKVIVEGIDFTYNRDISKIPKSDNTETVGDLLSEFFSYYANFSFKSHAISINSGEESIKPTYDALYIQNPLETMLNVSKNVSMDEVTRLRTCMETSLWKLETYSSNRANSPWGLQKILEIDSNSKIVNSKIVKKYGIALENLFIDGNDNSGTVPATDSKLDKYVDKVTEAHIPSRNSKHKSKDPALKDSIFNSN